MKTNKHLSIKTYQSIIFITIFAIFLASCTPFRLPSKPTLTQLFAIDYQTPREGYFYANTEIIKTIISV
jgi:hypothetical protein